MTHKVTKTSAYSNSKFFELSLFILANSSTDKKPQMWNCIFQMMFVTSIPATSAGKQKRSAFRNQEWENVGHTA